MSKKVKIILSLAMVGSFLLGGILCFLFTNEKDEYVVVFDSNGGSSISFQRVEEGDSVIKPKNPIKEEYDFVEWQLDGKTYNFKTKVLKDITLKAEWRKKEKLPVYEVNFDSDGGSNVSSQSIEEGKKINKPEDPTKNGYVFVEWQLDGKTYNFDSKIIKNITLKAKWITVDESLPKYEVKFNTDGGSLVQNQFVIENKLVNKPINPTKEGYRFVEWQLDGKSYNFNTKVVKNITLKATWKKIVIHTVTFDTNGGNNISVQKIESGNKVSNPGNPLKSNYVFTGWTLNGKAYNFNNPVTSDITLVANWRELYKYTVTFNSNGGTSVSNQVVVEGNKVSKPKDPTKSNYVFAGWLLNGSLYNFNNIVTSNIVLTAKWDLPPNENLISAQKLANNIDSLNIRIETLNENIIGMLSIPNGCSVNITNLPTQIERCVTDKVISLNFNITCGNEHISKNKNAIIAASPYKYTKVMNNNMLNYDVTVNGGSWNGNAKLFLGTSGSFNVIDRKAIVEINKIESNPIFLMKFNDNSKIIYHVPFKG